MFWQYYKPNVMTDGWGS